MHRTPFQKSAPLNPQFEADRSKGICNLWVTGPSLELHQRLVRTNGLQSTILIRTEMPTDADKLSNLTLNLIADAIVYRDVRSVVVCGQSSDVAVNSPRDQCSPQEEASGYDQMLQRICDRMERQRSAQERVLTQLDQIRTHPCVALALISQFISLCGMFYIPESDAFLVYDCIEDRFVPIANAG